MRDISVTIGLFFLVLSCAAQYLSFGSHRLRGIISLLLTAPAFGFFTIWPVFAPVGKWPDFAISILLCLTLIFFALVQVRGAQGEKVAVREVQTSQAPPGK